MIKQLTSYLVSLAIVLAPVPALSAEVGPLTSGGAAGVHQAQAGGNPPALWLAGAGVTVALGVMILMNNNGGAIVSGTLALGGNATAPGQGASISGAMAGGNGQSGTGAGAMSGRNQSGNGSSNSAVSIFAASGSFAIAPTSTTTTTTTGTQ